MALAVPENKASRRVIEKLGMTLVDRTHLSGLDVVQYCLMKPVQL